MTAADLQALLADAGLHIPGGVLRRGDLYHSDRIVLALLLQIERMKNPSAPWPFQCELAAALDLGQALLNLAAAGAQAAGPAAPRKKEKVA